MRAPYLGWMYHLVITRFATFVCYLGISKFGGIRPGAIDKLGEFTLSSWVAMLFLAEMGVRLVY